jgi:hypothetical protein
MNFGGMTYQMNGSIGTRIRRESPTAATGGFVVGGTSAPCVEDYG